MQRRRILAALLAWPGVALFGLRSLAATGSGRVRPGTAGWPTQAEWASLGRAVEDRLEPVSLPSLDPATAPELLSNPFFRGEQPALTQMAGWVDAWQSTPSAYVVKAKDASDVVEAVRFAAAHRLRV